LKYFLISKQSKYNFIIPSLLLIGSFSLYSYNLEGQTPHGDELLYLSWGGVYFDLIKEGDLNNPCLKNIADCGELLYAPKGRYEISYTPIRNFLVGFSQYLTTGENKGEFYQWSCAWYPCFDIANYWPSPEELSSGRLFSIIFGSLTIVLIFFIGKILFNRTIGLFASLTLLTFSLWVVNSRLIMSEVYLYFFILLSILFLLKSFKKENKFRILFFILAAISFGLAFNIKTMAFQMILPIAVMILFYSSFNEKLNFRFFKNRKNIIKVISLVLIFFVISTISFLVAFPRYYDDPVNKMLTIAEHSPGDVTLFSSFPTSEKNYLHRILGTTQVLLVPHLMDPYFHDLFPEEVEENRRYGQGIPFNYSTIPLSLFFFIGIIYMIRKIKTGNLNFSELALLVWFTSLFILSVLIADKPPIERYYLSPFFPLILIASYGLWNFIQQIQNQKGKIVFFMSFIIAHSLYLIPHIDKIYLHIYQWRFWKSPLPVGSELSLNEPIVYVSSIIFVVIFVIVYLRTKIYFVEGRLVIKK